ncbi:sulfotransferase family protein [Synechococcus sp. M16CYN]|uniref:sulfotransferase family protein n=1 Tax=Synechococcus sp. M16CYN TaxID=3103139 RepID=UPI003244DBC4
MIKSRHFIRIKHYKLLYGRVPKAANSSIKAALCHLLSQRPHKGIKTTADKFWQHATNNETELITIQEACKYRLNHFSFSFVRNPFDRLIAAYNNKVLEIKEPPLPMKNMKIYHGMSFESFLDVLTNTPVNQYDVHLLPQSNLLCTKKRIIPEFIGRFEQINEHWSLLRKILSYQGINVIESLPRKNVRRNQYSDLSRYFHSDTLIDKALQIYNDDIILFYKDINIDNLIDNTPLPKIMPFQSRSLQLLNWLKYNNVCC